jgi:hypothetical protein
MINVRQCRKIIENYLVKLRFCRQRRKQDRRLVDMEKHLDHQQS